MQMYVIDGTNNLIMNVNQLAEGSICENEDCDEIIK